MARIYFEAKDLQKHFISKNFLYSSWELYWNIWIDSYINLVSWWKACDCINILGLFVFFLRRVIDQFYAVLSWHIFKPQTSITWARSIYMTDVLNKMFFALFWVCLSIWSCFQIMSEAVIVFYVLEKSIQSESIHISVSSVDGEHVDASLAFLCLFHGESLTNFNVVLSQYISKP